MVFSRLNWLVSLMSVPALLCGLSQPCVDCLFSVLTILTERPNMKTMVLPVEERLRPLRISIIVILWQQVPTMTVVAIPFEAYLRHRRIRDIGAWPK